MDKRWKCSLDAKYCKTNPSAYGKSPHGLSFFGGVLFKKQGILYV